MNAQSRKPLNVSGGGIATSLDSLRLRSGRTWVWAVAILGTLGIAVAVAMIWLGLAPAAGLGQFVGSLGGGAKGSASLGPTATVIRGPMLVSVTEAGEVKAAKHEVVSNELRWPLIIKYVVAEGSRVSTGEKIVEFECKELLDEIEETKLQVTGAESEYTAARENLELKKKEMDNVVRKADQALIDAEEDRRRYEEGDWPVMRGEAESNIQLAEQDLALAKGKLEFKLKVNQDKELRSPYSDSEIEADQLAVARLEFSLQKAVSEKEMLLKYGHPREIRRLKAAVTDAELALERARVEKRTTLLVAEANAMARKQRYEMRKDRLAEYLADKEKLTVNAARSGLVVYDTGDHHRRYSGEVSVAVGSEISPRQQIMIIPDMSTLQVETKVYETIVDQVRPGLPAYIQLDARPGEQPLGGHVARVAPLPDSQRWWLSSGVKVFNVVVKFEEQPEGLKPGLTAEVELILADLPDVLSVPVAAVYTEQDRTFVRRVVGDQAERVSVRIGRMSSRRVEIVSGLQKGDRVLLVPPELPAGGVKKPPAVTTRPTGPPPAPTRPAGAARRPGSNRTTRPRKVDRGRPGSS